MECWAALSYCKRDVSRGPINPREPRDFRTFGLLEYRQELRSCSLNQFLQYQCVEKQSELCFEVLRNQGQTQGNLPKKMGGDSTQNLAVTD